MREEKGMLGWITGQHVVAALGLAGVCLIGVATAEAQVANSKQKLASPRRLLTVEEGRAVVTAAWEQSSSPRETQDCSHLVHQVYLNAGFQYPYVSSNEMYAGNKSFARVKFPHAGDLIVWPGHMGIVVDGSKHIFYSLVSTGLEEQDYESPYWRSRGRPHFYRYRVQAPIVLSATSIPASSQVSSNNKQHDVTMAIEKQSFEETSASNRQPKTAPEPTAVIYGPPAPPELENAAGAFKIRSSIIIAAGNKPPTREEVAESISALNDMAGSVLRSDDPFNVQLPVVIVEKFSVERVEIKRDHGWAQLQIDSKVWVGGGAGQQKGLRERVRWELRHTELGWEAITPSGRTYVSRDVAVRNLAAQLARLAESDGAADHPEQVVRQESHLANILSALLSSN